MALLFLTFLDNTVVSPILTGVQSDLHAGVTDLQWVVGAYALAFASLMLLFGGLADLFGRTTVLLGGVVVFLVGSVACAVADTPTTLIAGRVIMGVGAAASEPGTLSLIRHLFPEPRRRARALGVWAAVSGLALAMGPVLGGLMVGAWSWRAVFWFNVVFGGAVLIAGVVTLPRFVPAAHGRVDAAGFALSAVALASATYATIAGENLGYRSGHVITWYVVAVVAAVAFAVVEHRSDHPMVDLRYFRRPVFFGANAVAFASYFAVFSIFFFVALYLEVVVGASPFELALDFAPMLAGMVVGSLVAGAWVSRRGARLPMVLGAVIAAAGVVATDLVIGPHASVGSLGGAMGLAGVGFGIVVVPVTASALAAIPASHSGMASSTVNTARELGAVAGVAVLGSVVNGQLTVDLMNRLASIGVPPSFRREVITALTTGTLSAQAAQAAGTSSAAVQAIINRVVGAAYGALAHGLHLALGASAILLVVAAAVAAAVTRDGGGFASVAADLAD